MPVVLVVYGVTCSLVHWIRCAPDNIKGGIHFTVRHATITKDHSGIPYRGTSIHVGDTCAPESNTYLS